MSEEPPKIPEAPEIVVEKLSSEDAEIRMAKLRPFKKRIFETAELGAGYAMLGEFRKKLEKEYGVGITNRCRLLHFAADSTLDSEYIKKDTFFDFTGEYSVEKFLRDNFPEK